MSDFKAKLPDFKELTSMAGKLFKDVKTSVSEIIKDYKQKREPEAATASPKAKPEKEEVVTATKTPKTKTAKKDSSEKKKSD